MGNSAVHQLPAHHPVTGPTKRFRLFAKADSEQDATLGDITSQLTQTFDGPASGTLREFGGE
jgi:hypothetical protein